MKIIAIEREVEGVKADDFFPHLKDESRAVHELYQSGEIREIYYRADRDDAVLVLECRDLDEAESIVAKLPLVKEGLVEFQMIPLRAYPGFKRLFD